MSERTCVGIPLFEEESPAGLDITLKNIDKRLNELNIDSSIIVEVNGPKTAAGNMPHFDIDYSGINAEVEVIQGEELGQIRTLNHLIGMAAIRDIDRAFMTDADIHRLPHSLKAMWEQADVPIVGAKYRPYPIQVVMEEFGPLTLEERLLYQIFDGDQSPQVRSVLERNGLDRSDWVKGSLMLLEVDAVQHMHGSQYHAADSVMNRTLGRERSKVADGAYFLHMGRVDMGDHIKARLRHFKGAVANGDLEKFLHKEVALPDIETMNRIAQEIRETTDNGDFHAMLYLTRCAVRETVNQICYNIATEQFKPKKLGDLDPISMFEVVTFADAKRAISRFFMDIDWDDITGTSIGPPPPTQELLRRPFDFDRHMADKKLAQATLDTLGLVTMPR